MNYILQKLEYKIPFHNILMYIYVLFIYIPPAKLQLKNFA